MSVSGGNITAAATTGPASGPTPTSSTPAMSRTPDFHSSSSKWRIAVEAQPLVALALEALFQRVVQVA